MRTLELRLADLSADRLELLDLLQQWLSRTGYHHRVSSVSLRDDGEEAVATLVRGDRHLEVRLEHVAEDRWFLRARGWLAPAEPSGAWSRLLVVAIVGFGLAVSLGFLSWSPIAFWVGVVASILLGVFATRIARRRAERHRTTWAAGSVVDDLIRQLEPVLRDDLRVEGVAPA